MPDESRPEQPQQVEPEAPGPPDRGRRVAPEVALVERIFLGPGGIRAGWRLAIFIALMLLAWTLLLVVTTPVVRRFQLYGLRWSTLVGELTGFAAALVASLVMGRIEKRSFACYGLPARGAFGTEFWVGVVWGFIALTCLLLAIHAGHGFDFGRIVLSGRDLARDAALWGVTFLTVGFAEEYVFRGYALATLATGMGFWPSALLLSAAFGSVHLSNPGEDWAGALAAAVIGLFFCLTLRRTGSLWFAIGMHAGWDYAESFIYSVPDSGAVVPGHLTDSRFHGPVWLTGGSVGPEGSAFVFMVIGVCFLLFNLLYREARFRPENPVPGSGQEAAGIESLGVRQ